MPVIFSAPVSSHTALIGDRLSLQLSEDLVVNGQMVASNGTPVTGSVIQVDTPAMGGVPSVITFQIAA